MQSCHEVWPTFGFQPLSVSPWLSRLLRSRPWRHPSSTKCRGVFPSQGHRNFMPYAATKTTKLFTTFHRLDHPSPARPYWTWSREARETEHYAPGMKVLLDWLWLGHCIVGMALLLSLDSTLRLGAHFLAWGLEWSIVWPVIVYFVLCCSQSRLACVVYSLISQSLTVLAVIDRNVTFFPRAA